MVDGFQGPVFIVGMPRSGTKLLRGMLNGHSQLYIPLNETEFLPSWIRKWASFGDLSNRHTFMAFYQRFVDTFYFQNRMSEHGEQIKPDVWYNRCAGDFSIANVFEQLIRHDAEVPDTAIWGDKSPSYLNHIESIRAIYPEAKFIHLIRDARDYVLSLEKSFGKNKLRAAQRWNDSILLAQQKGESLGSDFIEVRYEDLVDDPEQQAHRLCDFIGIRFEPSMTILQRATENLGDTKGQQNIVAGNYGKYKTQLTTEELRSVESYCGEGLLRMGYSLEQHVGPNIRLTSLEEKRYQAGDVWRLIQLDAQVKGWVEAMRSRVSHFIKTQW